ncbi:MAG: acyltransferase [Acetatifactor sp.]
MGGKAEKDKERLVHMDLLRILAAFSVVMLHSSAQFWYVLPVISKEWFIVNAYDAVFRFGVPIFVMISGSLFLRDKRELKLRRLYTHHVLRMLILYVVWSLTYLVYDLSAVPRQDIGSALIWAKLSVNRYHLWFIPMITGVYMVLPILKRWVQNASKREVEYFLALFFVFQVGQETVSALTRHMALDFFQNMISLYLVTGYLGYFVLGYYLTEYELSGSVEKLLYAGGIVSVPVNIFLSSFLSRRAGQPLGAIFDSYGIFTCLITLALFVFFTKRVSRIPFSRGFGKIVQAISLSTLGIYLMHIGALEVLYRLGFHSMMIHPALGVPLCAVVIFTLCGVVSYLVHHIPVIGRYVC